MRQQLPIIFITALVAGCGAGLQLGNSSGATSSGMASTGGAHAGPSAMITIPDVMNLSEADAKAKLRQAGVTGEITIARPSLTGTSANQTLTGYSWGSDGLPSQHNDGHVCYQQPVAGRQTRARLMVQLERQDRARVFDAGGALDQRLDQIAYLTEHGAADAEQGHVVPLQTDPHLPRPIDRRARRRQGQTTTPDRLRV